MGTVGHDESWDSAGIPTDFGGNDPSHDYNVRPPSDVCWFRFAPVTSSLFAYQKNHSEIGVMFTN